MWISTRPSGNAKQCKNIMLKLQVCEISVCGVKTGDNMIKPLHLEPSLEELSLTEDASSFKLIQNSLLCNVLLFIIHYSFGPTSIIIYHYLPTLLSPLAFLFFQVLLLRYSHFQDVLYQKLK